MKRMFPLIVLGLMEFVRGALVFTLLPYYGQYAAGFSVGVIGTAISLHYVFDNLFRLPAGWMVDRFGGKWLVTAGLVISGLGVFLVYTHHNALFFIMGAALFGLGVSPAWPAVISGAVANMPAHQTGEALSKVFIAWLVGAGLGPVAVNFVIGKSYGVSFMLLFGVLTAAVVLTAVTLSHSADMANPLPKAIFLKELLRELFSLRVLYPGMFVQTLSVGILTPIFAIYGREELGLTPSQLNYFLIGAGIFTVLLLVPAGKFADRLGVKWPLAGGFLGAAVSLLLFPMQKSVVLAMIVAIGVGISYSFILPAWNGLMAKVVSPEKRGTMWAVFMTIEGLGTAVGAYIGGKVWDVLGHWAPFYTSAFFLGTMAAFYAFSKYVERLIGNRQNL